MSVRYFSLFSGIEAASAAWEPLGWKPVAFAEIEPFPSALLAQRYPSVPNLGDVSRVDWAPYRGAVDVVVGGSPCQAFSMAGLRKSLEDPRGNLTLEYVRAVHAIRPRYAVWENVPGVLSTSDNAFGCFLAALVGADEAIEVEEGWPSAGMVSGPAGRAAWRLLDAQWFGLAQRRLRVFVVFCPGDGADPGEVLFERPRLLGHPPTRGEAGQGVTHGVAGSLGSGGEWPADVSPPLNTSWADRSAGSQAQEWDSEKGGRFVPDVGYALNAKGGAGRMDAGNNETFAADVCPVLRSGGNQTGGDRPPGTDVTVESLVVEEISATLGAGDGSRGWRNDLDQGAFLPVAHSLRAEGFDSSEDGTGRGTPLVPVANSINGNSGRMQIEATYVPMAFHENQRGEVTVNDTAGALKVGGGKPGQGYPAIAYNLRGRDGGSMPEPTDVASIRAASGGSSRTYVGVRRLTVTECERLMGLPDGYTVITFRGKPAADGPRYRSLGNSMAVPVMRWIGERIEKLERAK